MMTSFSDIADAVAAANAIEVQSVAKVPGRVLFIDADMLCYQCGGNDDTDVATSRRILKSKIDLFMEASGADRVVLGLTGEGSTKGDRAVIAYTKPYQGQRKGHKPKNWQYLRNYIADGLAGQVKAVFDREADDLAGFMSEQYPGKVVLCSRDKDFRMLPGWHLNWDTYELVKVEPGQFALEAGGKLYGHKWWAVQMLWGDSADNIPGLPKHPDFMRGVGEVAAHKLLAFAVDMQSAVDALANAYKAWWGAEWADRFAEQAALLWIRRTAKAPINEWLEYMPGGWYTAELTEAATRQEARVNQLIKEAERINACQST